MVHVVAGLDRIPIVEGVVARCVQVRSRPAGDVELEIGVVYGAPPVLIEGSSGQVVEGSRVPGSVRGVKAYVYGVADRVGAVGRRKPHNVEPRLLDKRGGPSSLAPGQMIGMRRRQQAQGIPRRSRIARRQRAVAGPRLRGGRQGQGQGGHGYGCECGGAQPKCPRAPPWAARRPPPPSKGALARFCRAMLAGAPFHPIKKVIGPCKRTVTAPAC